MRPVLLLYAPETDHVMARRVRHFNDRGYRARPCHDIAGLRQEVQQALLLDGLPPVIAILASGSGPNKAAAKLLAGVPQVGVLLLLESTDDAALTAAFQLAVDSWCLQNSAISVITLALHNLRRRLEYQRIALLDLVPSPDDEAVIALAPPASEPSWLLHEQAWQLGTPGGKSIKLTSHERAFLLTLARMPELSGSHAELLPKGSGNKQCEQSSKTRLAVLVTRLRQKVAQQHEAELPIRSLHGRGYMFAGDLKIQGISSGAL